MSHVPHAVFSLCIATGALLVLSSGSSATGEEPCSRMQLLRCSMVAASDRENARCPHRHAGAHFLLRSKATVGLMPNGLLHIVEPCGPGQHAEGAEDEEPYVLWYTMAAPSPAQGAPDGGCPSAKPYAQVPYATNVPNANHPDPVGRQSIVARHWATPAVNYWVNIPTGSGATDLFGGMLTPVTYTRTMFSTDIQTIMGSATTGLGATTTANIPAASFLGTTTLDYDLTPLTPSTAVVAASGQLIWAGNGQGAACGGPTGDGVNEFIFLTTARSLGGVTGGLTSMLVDPATGVIAECDVIYSPIGGQGVWGSDPRKCTGLAHEIGHFWGLDHTNLHPGGGSGSILPAAIGGAPPSLGMAYGAVNDFPAKVSSYGRDDSASRVTDPWRTDDKAAFSVNYPVTGLSATKSPLINTSATLIGQVIDSALDSPGMFGFNVYVVNRMSGSPPTIPGYGVRGLPGVPPVGSISGTYRSSAYSITGASDTFTGARCTGEFRIDGIPATFGSLTEYDVYVEPLASIGMSNTLFGEWWTESMLNALLNAMSVPLVQVARLSNSGSPGGLAVGSVSMTPGSIVQLHTPIDIDGVAAGTFALQVESASRPVVDVIPRTWPAPVFGSNLTIIVSHNRSAFTGVAPPVGPAPLQTLTCTWNGKPLRLSFISTAGTAPTQIMTTYTAAVPFNPQFPAIVEVTALEPPGAAGQPPSVVGRNMVMY